MILRYIQLKNINLKTLNIDNIVSNTLNKNLNFEQLIATTNINGNFLVIAGAGSGKTRIIIYRTFLLLKLGISPKKILILTFTRKASKEIRSRIDSLFVNSQVQIETFHSLAYKCLKKYSQNKSFKVITPENYFNLSKTSIFFEKISKIISQEQIKKLLSIISEDDAVLKKEILQFKTNEKNLILNFLHDLSLVKLSLNIFTFNDLIKSFITFLDNKIFSVKFDYVMVDEYQDTDSFQISILKKISNTNLMVVGDDFQSIYGFKGTSPDNILNFPFDFPKVKTIILNKNYRSTPSIVNFSNEVSNSFLSSFKKELISTNLNLEKPSLNIFKTHFDEIKNIIEQIKNLIFENSSCKIALLFRNYIHMESFIKDFKKANLSFSIIPNPFLESIFDDIIFDENAQIELLTIHSSKGLEWDYVFIPLLLDGILPSCIGQGIDFEEEKRLFYVACTRTKKQLFLSYPLTFYNDFGFFNKVSPFITDISSEFYNIKRGQL
ncbi:ATP-dependent helicase [Cetobacterium sp. 8H]|uniref:ATP-dependent helicase n=1 Tax=Cetobacterium sp. 8H TaxID=2759681 RepID=UPI00163BC629|nr:ATP-dependent helicase [Cetobacterium sp. 8H]MBC2851410.1 ATP-dependent helicase [Cetobacterium sp. 8H]